MTFPERIGYRTWIQVRLVYVVILTLTILGAVFRYFKFPKIEISSQLWLMVATFFGAVFIWESLRLINITLNRHYPFERNLPGRIMVQLGLGSVFGIICRTLIYFFAEPYFPFQVDSLFMVVTWALWATFPTGINLIFFAGYFFNQWKEGLLKSERLEREKSQVQFDNLKNQLNPHFLFNALTSLNSLIQNDPALASEFLKHLSKVYRYVLQHKEEARVNLQTELEFIRNYIFLAETRFDKALSIQVQVAEKFLDKGIVPVTLQVLLENAFKHNVLEPSRPLKIMIEAKDDYLVIGNNLQKRRNVESSNQIGLENLKNLYRFLSPRPLVVEQTDTEFIVKVPLL